MVYTETSLPSPTFNLTKIYLREDSEAGKETTGVRPSPVPSLWKLPPFPPQPLCWGPLTPFRLSSIPEPRTHLQPTDTY